jgi:hypothetical protein
MPKDQIECLNAPRFCQGVADKIGEDATGRNVYWCASCGSEWYLSPEDADENRPEDWDAPPAPPGLRRRPGVTYGCERPDCRDCYEPVD